jgi:hypothetical protein
MYQETMARVALQHRKSGWSGLLVRDMHLSQHVKWSESETAKTGGRARAGAHR